MMQGRASYLLLRRIGEIFVKAKSKSWTFSKIIEYDDCIIILKPLNYSYFMRQGALSLSCPSDASMAYSREERKFSIL